MPIKTRGVDRLIQLNLSELKHSLDEGRLEIYVPAKEWPHDSWAMFIGQVLDGMPMDPRSKDVFAEAAGDAVGRLLDIEIVKSLVL